MKKTIYVLGNPLEETDSFAVKLMPNLQKTIPEFEFVRLDPTEEFPFGGQKHVYLLDSVMGISEVKVFSDLSHLELSPRVSVHDFDLPILLGLLKKLGKIKKVTIIGIPQKGNNRKITKEVVKILKSI